MAVGNSNKETSIGVTVPISDGIKDGDRSIFVGLGGVKYLANSLVLFLIVDSRESNMSYTVGLSLNCEIASIVIILV